MAFASDGFVRGEFSYFPEGADGDGEDECEESHHPDGDVDASGVVEGEDEEESEERDDAGADEVDDDVPPVVLDVPSEGESRHVKQKPERDERLDYPWKGDAVVAGEPRRKEGNDHGKCADDCIQVLFLDEFPDEQDEQESLERVRDDGVEFHGEMTPVGLLCLSPREWMSKGI